MNYTRIMVASFAAFVAYFVFGGLWDRDPIGALSEFSELSQYLIVL